MAFHQETLAVHAGWNGDPATHACGVPVYRTTAYNFDNAQHGADLFALKDFKSLCVRENIEIREVKAESRHLVGKILMFLGFNNLGASKIVARIARKTV